MWAASVTEFDTGRRRWTRRLIAGLLCPFNGLMQFADTHAIFISAAKSGVIGRNTFKRVTGSQADSNWDSGWSERSSTSGSLKLCHRLFCTKVPPPWRRSSKPFASRLESPHAERDVKRRTVLPARVLAEVSHRGAESLRGLKTPAAAQSHQIVLVGEFCCRPYSLSYAFFARSQLVLPILFRIAKVTKYSLLSILVLIEISKPCTFNNLTELTFQECNFAQMS